MPLLKGDRSVGRDRCCPAVAGPGRRLKTSSYSLIANDRISREGSPAQITGYTATNVIEAVAAEPTLAGQVIGTTIGAGANRINNVQLVRSRRSNRLERKL